MLECLVYGERAAEASLDDGRQMTDDSSKLSAISHQLSNFTFHVSRFTHQGSSSTEGTRLDRDLGVERDGDTLRALIADLPDPDAHSITPDDLIAALTARAALLREESRGAHYRTDFPQTQPEWQGRILWRRGESPRFEPITQIATSSQQLVSSSPYAL
jgi:aspartate oxidase